MTRRFFIELDKAGAEWVVVAYLSGDANMISVVESGKSPHIVTGSLMTGLPEEVVEKESKLVKMLNDPILIDGIRREHCPEVFDAEWIPRSMSIRQCGKKANHGLNYVEGWFRFAEINELEASESKKIVHTYSHVAYPSLPTWWDSIGEEAFRNGRFLYNLLGHKRRFLGRRDDQLIKSMIAYKPQSTIGHMVRIGMRETYRRMERRDKLFRDLDMLANVHDNLLFTYPYGKWFSAAKVVQEIDRLMSPILTARTRTFRIRTDIKVGVHDWGHMTEVKFSPNVNELASRIRDAVKAGEDAKKAA